MILFLSVAMLLAGCDKDNAPVAVSEVTLSRTALTMTVGDTEKLTATVLPEHAGYDGLVWSSNNTSVALVDVEGLVTAVSAGRFHRHHLRSSARSTTDRRCLGRCPDTHYAG